MPLYQPANVHAPVLSQFSLKGKTAILTGGALGIGLEIVRALVEAGADVALIKSTSSDAHDIAAKIAQETNQRVEAFQSDVTSRTKIVPEGNCRVFRPMTAGFVDRAGTRQPDFHSFLLGRDFWTMS